MWSVRIYNRRCLQELTGGWVVSLESLPCKDCEKCMFNWAAPHIQLNARQRTQNVWQSWKVFFIITDDWAETGGCHNLNMNNKGRRSISSTLNICQIEVPQSGILPVSPEKSGKRGTPNICTLVTIQVDLVVRLLHQLWNQKRYKPVRCPSY